MILSRPLIRHPHFAVLAHIFVDPHFLVLERVAGGGIFPVIVPIQVLFLSCGKGFSVLGRFFVFTGKDPLLHGGICCWLFVFCCVNWHHGVKKRRFPDVCVAQVSTQRVSPCLHRDGHPQSVSVSPEVWSSSFDCCTIGCPGAAGGIESLTQSTEPSNMVIRSKRLGMHVFEMYCAPTEMFGKILLMFKSMTYKASCFCACMHKELSQVPQEKVPWYRPLPNKPSCSKILAWSFCTSRVINNIAESFWHLELRQPPDRWR